MAASGERSGGGWRGRRQAAAEPVVWNFRVERDRAAIGRFQDGFERKLGAEIPQDKLRALQVALDELLTNVVMHAEQAAGSIEVAISLHAAAIETRISYLAEAFDPTTWEPAPLDESVTSARIGGRGILLVRALMDDFAYSHDAGWNVVSLRVRLND
jgi:anti-sigma regulatory factor (Ser/Thr protein kinase)